MSERFDVAISYAFEQMALASGLNDELRQWGFKVFFDQKATASLLAEDLHEKLPELYSGEASAYIVVCSNEYVKNEYTGIEWKSILAAKSANPALIVVPILTDEATLPDLPGSVVYSRDQNHASFCALFLEKFCDERRSVSKTNRPLDNDLAVLRFRSTNEVDRDSLVKVFELIAKQRKASSDSPVFDRIGLLLPPSVESYLADFREFMSKSLTAEHSNEARKQSVWALDKVGPKLRQEIVEGLRLLTRTKLPDNDPELAYAVAENFVLGKFVSATRLLLSVRLVGIKLPFWAVRFDLWAANWGTNILEGLAPIAAERGIERFFWFDVDFYDPGYNFRIRAFLPISAYLIDRESDDSGALKFLRKDILYPQILDEALVRDDKDFVWQMFDIPKIWRFSVRSEVFMDCRAFERSANRNKDLYDCVIDLLKTIDGEDELPSYDKLFDKLLSFDTKIVSRVESAARRKIQSGKLSAALKKKAQQQ